MNNYYGILLALLTGLATLIGAALVLFNKHKSDKKIVFILGLSTGIMTILSLFELLPESFELISEKYDSINATIVTIAFALIGYLITLVVDKLLEHTSEHELKHVGLITMVAVSMHKLPEGIALFIASLADIKLGIGIALASAMHHIPEGMMIALPTYYASNSKKKALKYAFISSLATPLGALFAMLVLGNVVKIMLLGSLFAVAIGMFVFIIINELIPTAIQYKQNKTFFGATLIGLMGMLIIHSFH